MTSKVIVPVSDFAAIITRIEKLEDELSARKEREARRYNHGPCLRCGYGPWESFRAAPPKCCPRCHSAYWDQEPRYKGARTPDDPPNPKWTTAAKPGPRERAAARVAAPVVEAAVPTPTPRPPVILPPELRPPGEPLIPPPPLPDVIAARTVDNPMNVKPVTLSEQLRSMAPSGPIADNPEYTFKFDSHSLDIPPLPHEHVAPLPDTIVERILTTGDFATPQEIRAAKEGGDAELERGTEGTPTVGDATGTTARPDPSALAETKAAFFAGFEVPAGTPDADPAPFVTNAEPPTLAPKPDDDPFWK